LNSVANDFITFDQGDGDSLYAAGSFALFGPSGLNGGIARWDGQQWQSVGGGLNGVGYALAKRLLDRMAADGLLGDADARGARKWAGPL